MSILLRRAHATTLAAKSKAQEANAACSASANASASSSTAASNKPSPSPQLGSSPDSSRVAMSLRSPRARGDPTFAQLVLESYVERKFEQGLKVEDVGHKLLVLESQFPALSPTFRTVRVHHKLPLRPVKSTMLGPQQCVPDWDTPKQSPGPPHPSPV
ncbi:uncharacterized protein LOC62_05G007639 [Vanrija pseudolonga]|uniref:Uncharacterized protein n=1 Tax=Vanrija pseudolonga TaxID=143232 RepID=A0AAF1BKL7_9TREE|nr:hypothetical protein LOC62_05G007639 [Vanrija pseudolonga]